MLVERERVTVLLPVYNGMPHLPIAVMSILKQTFKEFKMLIISDGSTDGTIEYLKGLDDPRLHIIDQEHRGLGATLNHGLELCNTEYLARMDADDYSMPERLEKQVEFMDANPDVCVVGCQIEYFSKDPNISGFPTQVHTRHEDIKNCLMRPEHALTHPTLLFRTSVIKDIGGYRFTGIGEDWDLFLRIGQAGRLANLPECLHKMRVHAESVTWKYSGINQRYNLYSVDCAKRRSIGLPEQTLEEFTLRYGRRPLLRKTIDYLSGKSLFSYRKGIIAYLEGRRLVGVLRLIFAGLVDPIRIIRRGRRFVRLKW